MRLLRRESILCSFRRISSSELALKKQLLILGAAIRPRKPISCWMNSTLLSVVQVRQAVDELANCGLPLRDDLPKNWDALSTLKYILDNTNSSASILEVGAQYSLILFWLYQFGYRNLRGIDLSFETSMRIGPICYEHGDLTATRFSDASFDVIIALSVIEHGVCPEAYFREMSRILRPAGILITSTDYWEHPVATWGKSAFDVPIKIFTKVEIKSLLTLAKCYELELTGEVALNCHDKVVCWKPFDLHYTFVCFALQKKR